MRANLVEKNREELELATAMHRRQEMEHRAARTSHWIRQLLGVLPVVLLVAGFLDLGSGALVLIGSSLLLVQLAAYFRERVDREE